MSWKKVGFWAKNREIPRKIATDGRADRPRRPAAASLPVGRVCRSAPTGGGGRRAAVVGRRSSFFQIFRFLIFLRLALTRFSYFVLQMSTDGTDEVADLPANSIWNKAENANLPVPRQFRRRPAHEIVGSREFKNRRLSKEWDDYDTILYNCWQQVVITGPKLIRPHDLRGLRLWNELEDCMERIGMGDIGTTEYLVYPDLTRQFLASVQLIYPRDRNKVPSQGQLSFKIDGTFYTLRMREIEEVFGFEKKDNHYDMLKTPASFPNQAEFWEIIGSGSDYNASKTKQSSIRHPVLRVLAKLLSHTLLCRSDPGRLHANELTLLYLACKNAIELEDTPQDRPFSMGALWADHIVHMAKQLTNGDYIGKRIGLGMFFTPLFHYCSVPLRAHRGENLVEWIDRDYLWHSLKLSLDGKYNFTWADGRRAWVQLPLPEWGAVDTLEHIGFLPPAEVVTFTEGNQRQLRRRQQTEQADVPDSDAEIEEPIPPPRQSTSRGTAGFAGTRGRADTVDWEALMCPPQPTLPATELQMQEYTLRVHRRQFSFFRWLTSSLTGCARPHSPPSPTAAPLPPRHSHAGHSHSSTAMDIDPQQTTVGAGRRSTSRLTRAATRRSTDTTRLEPYHTDPMRMAQPPPDFFYGGGSGTGGYESQESRSPEF